MFKKSSNQSFNSYSKIKAKRVHSKVNQFSLMKNFRESRGRESVSVKEWQKNKESL